MTFVSVNISSPIARLTTLSIPRPFTDTLIKQKQYQSIESTVTTKQAKMS